MAAYVPRFTLLVDDLAALSDDALQARTLDAMARLALVMLRDNRHPERLLALFATWRDTFRTLLARPQGSEMLRSLLIYVATVSDLHFEQIRATIHEHLPEAEPTAVTTARQLIQQGLEKGREQGLETGRKQTVLRMLGLKFGALDEASARRVEQASAQELDRILERALRSATLAEALAR